MIRAYCDICRKPIAEVDGCPQGIWHYLIQDKYFGQEWNDYRLDKRFKEGACKECRDGNKSDKRKKMIDGVNTRASKCKCPEKFDNCIGMECQKFHPIRESCRGR